MINFNSLSKYIFFVFFILFPFTFLSNNLLLAKTFLIVFVSFIFILQLLESFKTKEFLIPKNLLIFFVFFSLFSVIFSKNILLSLWESNYSFFILFALFLLFVFAKNIFKNKEDVNILIYCLCFSLIVLSIIISTDIFISPSINSLVLLVAVALGFSLYCVFSKKRKFEIIIYSIFSFVYFCVLLIIGFKISWFIVSLFAFFIFWEKARENNFSFKNKKTVFSFLFFITCFLLFLNTNFVGLSVEQTMNVSFYSISSNIKSFIFGSGPGTFSYQYAKIFIPASIDQGSSGFLTILSDFGFLGFLLFFLTFIYFSIKGFKVFLKNNSDIKSITFLTTLILFIILFIWQIEFILFILLFIFLGIFESFCKKDKAISFKSLLVVFIVFFSMSICFFRYIIAEKLFIDSLVVYEHSLDEAIFKIEKASNLFNSSKYYIGLSQLYLLKATDIFDNNWNLDENFKKQKEENENIIKELASQSEVIAKKATMIDPYNYLTWQNLAWVYENTSFLISDNSEEAINALNKTIELSPKNYLAYIVKGRIHESIKEKDKALEDYKKAFEINPYYEGLKEKIENLTNF